MSVASELALELRGSLAEADWTAEVIVLLLLLVVFHRKIGRCQKHSRKDLHKCAASGRPPKWLGAEAEPFLVGGLITEINS